MKQIVLASASPRRRELLTKMGYCFIVDPAKGDEVIPPNATYEQTARLLAKQKATEVAQKYPDSIVIGADTVVALDGVLFGKPTDPSDAVRMLSLLRNRTHQVVTGVAVIAEGKCSVGHCVTEVEIGNLSDEEIASYVAGGSPLDKAGAYGIQDEQIVCKYQGSYTNVVGFPIELVQSMLQSVRG